MNRNIPPTIDPFAGDYIEGGLTFVEQAADPVLAAGWAEGWHRQKDENPNQQKPIATATTTDSADVDRGSRRHHSLSPYHKIGWNAWKSLLFFSLVAWRRQSWFISFGTNWK